MPPIPTITRHMDNVWLQPVLHGGSRICPWRSIRHEIVQKSADMADTPKPMMGKRSSKVLPICSKADTAHAHAITLSQP